MGQEDAATGPRAHLDYQVTAGVQWAAGKGRGPSFILIRNAGSGEADGVYRPSDRRWLDHDVYQNRYGDCIISRESHKSPKTGEEKFGFVLGKDGRPLYGVKTDVQEVPSKGWKAFQGQEPAPEVLVFKTWSEACQQGAWYFAEEAENAAKTGHWKVVLMFADRAFDLHTTARPKGRGDAREGGNEWAQQLCSLLGTRAEALLHMGEYMRALVDASAAVHFVPAFEWSKARTRGITACVALGALEDQAKLFMEEMCKRSDREFPGIKALDPLVEAALEKARGGKLEPVVLKDETPDDGRLYFKVVNPDDCTLYSTPNFTGKVLGRRNFNEILRGEHFLKNSTWIELHVSEAFDDSLGHRRAYAPVFTEGDEEEREEVLERCAPRDYPRRPRWEEMRLHVRPLGMKPPSDREAPVDYGRWQDPEPAGGVRIWPYVYKHGLCISCMVKGVSEGVIDSFVRFHWVTGWNHIYLFFDDPEDPAIRHAKALEEYSRQKKNEGAGLTVIRMDDEWWDAARKKSRFFQRREKNDMYESVCVRFEKFGDLNSKRMIVMDMAVQEAHATGQDWFVHLDIDECVYVPRMFECSSRRFFGSKERKVVSIRLWNHEAVPERTICQDWFRETTLFLLNKHHCRGFKAPREYDELLRRREGRELEPRPPDPDTDWWREIHSKIFERRQVTASRLDLEPVPEAAGCFTSYSCGKMVVRLERHLRAPVPCSSYSYIADNGDLLECQQASSGDDAVILHYPNAGSSYWRQKHEMQGEIPKECREGLPRAKLDSSHMVLHRPRRDQDIFFKTFIMQNDHNELAYMAEHGLVVRVVGVRDFLYYYDNPEEPEYLPGQSDWVDPNTGLKLGR